ncbi:MAG: hypothetical protein K6G74_01420 [Bacilli bacterium]|nr:hypothetical protein [Bacilli bacterium]
MKVLVRFDPGVRNDIFEGTRLRKSIKGGLELNNIKWVESIFAEPDICHFLSPIDEPKAHEAKADGYPVVVSALYAESDPYCRFLERSPENFYSLPQRSLKMLNEADLVLVPTLSAKNLLFQCGYQNQNIEVLPPGVNLARFEEIDPLEAQIFYRYFKLPRETKYAIAIGDLDDKITIEKAKILAELTPNITFFFFGSTTKTGDAGLKKLNKQSLANLRFAGITEDDVYRSGISGATCFVEFGETISQPVEELEAMAVKVPIVHVGKTRGSGLLQDGVNCYSPSDVTEAAKIIDSLSTSKDNAIIMQGYKMARENSLSTFGEKLKGLYESLIKKMEENQK